MIQPTDAHYEAARALSNGMIDTRPRLIARCVDVADVITAVNFAIRACCSRFVAANQVAMDGFVQMNAGTISPAKFFAPENIARIMAAAQIA